LQGKAPRQGRVWQGPRKGRVRHGDVDGQARKDAYARQG
jgi:hypothetical protein